MNNTAKKILEQATEQVKESVSETNSIRNRLMYQPPVWKETLPDMLPISEKQLLFELSQLLVHTNLLLATIASTLLVQSAESGNDHDIDRKRASGRNSW